MKNTRAFTLVELVVVIMILVILGLIWFVSYSDSIIMARDSQRSNDLAKLQIDLKSHKQKEWSYPMPVGPVNITNSWTMVYQGTMTSAIISNVLSDIPKDPKTALWYWYSTTTNRQQFQIALTLENNIATKAVVKGDYRSVAKNLFPTLFLAVTGSTIFDVNVNMQKFILNEGNYNLPYDMKWILVAKGVTFSGIVAGPGVVIESGGNYLSCGEIYEAGRSMGSGTYQIVNNSGALTDTGCLMN